MKTCVRCSYTKEESEFYPRDSTCKVCRKALKAKQPIKVAEIDNSGLSEVHGHFGGQDGHGPHVSNYDGEKVWTLEVYGSTYADVLTKLGAKPIPTVNDGTLFQVTAKQLILFVGRHGGFPTKKLKALVDAELK